MAINITFHGAAGMVTGSKHLLEVPRSNGHTLRILLDCGMFQGEGKESDEKNRRFGFDPRSVDMVVLSHAHIDHSGLLPRLVKEGFSGPIYCTPATRDLCTIMLEDSARIQEYDHAYDVKRAKKRGRPIKTEGPLYEVADVQPTLAAFQVVDYHETFKLAEGVTLTFTDAGHILGSACVHLAIDRPEGPLHLTFSGDVGRYVDRLLPDPEAFPQADVIICESTYGDRDHATAQEKQDELLTHVQNVCVKNKGKLIIPAFSIGKTQELLYTLNGLFNEGRLPRDSNSNGYPSSLQILVDGVGDDKHPKRQKIRFLRRLPRDPMFPDASVEPEKTWGLRSYSSDAGDPKEGSDIYDIYSRSPLPGLNSVPYRVW